MKMTCRFIDKYGSMVYYSNMKTTLDISDNILLRAKHVARLKHRTLKSLTEEGLVKVIESLESEKTVDIKPVTFKGQGLSCEFAGKSWVDIRDAAYEGRGC